MTDILSSAAASLQAALTGQLIKDLSQAVVAIGTVSAAPSALQNPGHPIAVTGTITSQAENGGSAVVQTTAGPVTVSLPRDTPLPHGTVTVLIQPGNPPTASILTGQTSITSQAAIQTQTTNLQTAQQAQAQAPLQPLQVGQIVTATALPVPSPGAPPPQVQDPHSPAPRHIAHRRSQPPSRRRERY